MKLQLSLISVIAFILFSENTFACTGGTYAGTLTPTVAYQTQTVSNGQYYAVNVTCGSTYNFTFCSNGGSAAWDTQITINQTNNTTQLAYNDDYCGLYSNVSWTATFTGTINVLISQYSCNNGGGNSATLAYNITATSVNYTASCTSANPTITGATGGTFVFNPAPTDGAIINSGTGAITNATEGASYSVDYTYCGGTISIPITMGTAPCYTLNGNGQYITVGGEPCIQLTDEINNQTGCAWSDSQIDFGSDFTLSLDYYFGNNINGADGNTFTFQPSSSTACGQAGGQLGAGGLANALSIEFDTYDNDNPAHIVDIACDHIAVEIDGDMLNAAPYCGPVCAKPNGANIDDGGTYTVEIQWDASTQTLNIYFDGNLRLTCSGNFVSTVFGGQSSVYWGATSATGGLNNQQYFCPSTVTILPVEIASFQSNCYENQEHFIWITESEQDVKHFVLEYTYDGFVYQPLSTIDAIGNSEVEYKYEFSMKTSDNQQRYYRLKMVDEDGEFKYSQTITGKGCCTPEIISQVDIKSDETTVQFRGMTDFALYNLSGQLVLKGNGTDGQTLHISNDQFEAGIYLIKAVDSEGLTETRRLFMGSI